MYKPSDDELEKMSFPDQVRHVLTLPLTHQPTYPARTQTTPPRSAGRASQIDLFPRPVEVPD